MASDLQKIYFTAATWNLMRDEQKQNHDHLVWSKREPLCLELIQEMNCPMILEFQEARNVDDFLLKLARLHYSWCIHDNNTSNPEIRVVTCYRNDCIELVKSETYWLNSDYKQCVVPKTWSQKRPRPFGLDLFRIITNNDSYGTESVEFYVANTHFGHTASEQIKSVAIVRDILSALDPNTPILMGMDSNFYSQRGGAGILSVLCGTSNDSTELKPYTLSNLTNSAKYLHQNDKSENKMVGTFIPTDIDQYKLGDDNQIAGDMLDLFIGKHCFVDGDAIVWNSPKFKQGKTQASDHFPVFVNAYFYSKPPNCVNYDGSTHSMSIHYPRFTSHFVSGSDNN
jgi:hypothetical protein